MRRLLLLLVFPLAACTSPTLDVSLAGEGNARLCVITRGGAINPCCTTPGNTAQCKAPGVSAGTAFEVQLFRSGADTKTWTVGEGAFTGAAHAPVSFAFALTADSLTGTYTLPDGQNAAARWSLR